MVKKSETIIFVKDKNIKPKVEIADTIRIDSWIFEIG